MTRHAGLMGVEHLDDVLAARRGAAFAQFVAGSDPRGPQKYAYAQRYVCISAHSIGRLRQFPVGATLELDGRLREGRLGCDSVQLLPY